MDLTIVLVGPTQHGKSETGNCILGRKAFKPRTSSSRVTETCELQTSVLKDGQTINVIDTPGFVDTESELLGEEVKKCITLARNGIHAILFVASVNHLFSTKDQIEAIRKLQTIFGKNIFNYMTVVLTGGDEVSKSSVHYTAQEIIRLCEDRYVRFHNRTTYAMQRAEQVQILLSKVKTVISHNAGLPFMSQVLELQIQVEARLTDTTTRLEQQLEAATLKANERAEKYFKEATSELIQRISKSYEEQMTQRLEAVEQRVVDTATRHEQQLAEAHTTHMRVNEIAQCETSELILKMTQRINEVESRVKDVTAGLEQQLAEAHAAHIRVNEIVQCEISELILQMTQSINEEAESRVKNVTTRLEQQLAEAEAARLKAAERAQEAQKISNEQIKKLVEIHETTMNAEEISELIQQLSKSNKEQTAQIIDVVEARLRDTTTSLEQRMEAATLKAEERAEKYLKEETSELIQRISKSYEEQMTQRLQAVEQRVLDMTTRLEQQLVEAHATKMKVNEIAQQQMTQRINEEVESRVKDIRTRLERELAEAEAARLKADERAQEAQKNLDKQIPKLKDVGGSSFHVYDPSTYLLQSTIK